MNIRKIWSQIALDVHKLMETLNPLFNCNFSSSNLRAYLVKFFQNKFQKSVFENNF